MHAVEVFRRNRRKNRNVGISELPPSSGGNVIDNNPNTLLGYALWTSGILGSLGLSINASRKNEKLSTPLLLGTAATLAVHLTTSAIVVGNGSLRNTPQPPSEPPSENSPSGESAPPTAQQNNVATILNEFFNTSVCGNFQVSADSSNPDRSGNFTLTGNTEFGEQNDEFELTQEEINELQTIPSGENQAIYNYLLPLLSDVSSSYIGNKLSVKKLGLELCKNTN